MNKKSILWFLVVLAVFLIPSVLTGCGEKGEESSAVVVLEEPDQELLGGWIFKNPNNEFELMAFEFGPDSTFVVKQFANGVQVGEKLTGSCVYLKVNGYHAIEMTLEGKETEYYYYEIDNGVATFTDSKTGEVMTLYLVINPNTAESE